MAGHALEPVLAARAGWGAVALGFTAVGSSGLNHLAKALVARPRPAELLVHVEHVLPAGCSLPAGHVVNFTVFAGLPCHLAWVRSLLRFSGPRWWRSWWR